MMLRKISITSLSLVILWMSSCTKDQASFPLDRVFKDLQCDEAVKGKDVSIYIIPESSKQRDLFFKDDFGFTVGDAGSIIRSIDKGVHWDVLHRFDQEKYNDPSNLTNARLQTVFFTDENNGFIGGSSGYDYQLERSTSAIFLTTQDGGQNWVKSEIKNTQIIFDLYFYNNLEGFGLFHVINLSGVSENIIVKTVDGGKNWKKVNLALGSLMSNKFQVVDGSLIVLAIDLKGEKVIARSDRATNVWTTRKAPSNDCLILHAFAKEASYCYCQEEVYVSYDEGVKWSETNIPILSESTVHFFSKDDGIIVSPIYKTLGQGGGSYKEIDFYKIIQTADGGKTWDENTLPKECNLEGVSYINASGTLHIINKQGEIVIIK